MLKLATTGPSMRMWWIAAAANLTGSGIGSKHRCGLGLGQMVVALFTKGSFTSGPA